MSVHQLLQSRDHLEGVISGFNTHALKTTAQEAQETLLDTHAGYHTTHTSALATKAPLESPTFTGNVQGITKDHVGLPNVNNTSDMDKPISTAVQAALDGKAPIGSVSFTGITAETQTTLDLKADASALTSGLAAKADASALTSGLAAKADASALTSGLAAKADTSALTS